MSENMYDHRQPTHWPRAPRRRIMSRTWDIGDPEPEDVDAVEDYTAPDFDPADSFHESPRWGRTYKGDWEGYKNGKVYTDWDDLVRRWGPLTEES